MSLLLPRGKLPPSPRGSAASSTQSHHPSRWFLRTRYIVCAVALVVAPAVAAVQPAPTATAEMTGSSQGTAEVPALEGGIKREIAVTRSTLSRTEELLASLQRGLEERPQLRAEALDRLVRLGERLDTCQPECPEADTVYLAIVDELQAARPLLRTALAELHSPSAVPALPAEPSPIPSDIPQLQPRLDELAALRSRLRQVAAEARQSEAKLRWARLEHAAMLVRSLNQLRLASIAKLSPQQRDDILGVTREGVAQLRRELEHLDLASRLYWVERLQDLRRLPALAGDPFVVGSATLMLVRIGLVTALLLFLRSRLRRILDRLRRFLFRRAQQPVWKRRASTLAGILEAVAPWILFIGALLALRRAAGPAAGWPEAVLAFRLALLYGLYRLGTDGAVALLLRLAGHYKLQLSAERRAKLIASVRVVMRVLAVLAGLLLLSDLFLGRGYLSHVVTQLAWMIILATLVIVLISWKAAIAESYLEHHRGRLARIVQGSQDRWYGAFVAPGAFLWLAGRVLLGLGRDFVLGFEQTRKALAFVFRRRVERQAEQQGYADAAPETLPQALVSAFCEEPVAEAPLMIDSFPGLEVLQEAQAQWRRDRIGGCFLLTGDQGIGKSTWLSRIPEHDLLSSRLAFDGRLLSPEAVAAFFAPALLPGGSPEPVSIDAIAAELRSGPPRLIVLDLAQHLFLGTVGGYRGCAAFVELVHRTNDNVFWVCAMSRYAWGHLQAVRPDLAMFDHHLCLGPWSEERIRQLIHARVEASGLGLSYRDLAVGRLEGVSAQDRLIESQEGYTRLLWDYSDGNPRVALHLFLRSLVPESDLWAHVRLFRAPPVEELEALDERGLLLLAAIITHDSLTLAEAVQVMRFPEVLCGVLLERLRALGVIGRSAGRHQVTTYWHRAAVRLLNRRNLLPA